MGIEDKKTYENLPGTPYSRYAIPLEYLPSRDYTPRWGYGKPVYEPLRNFFANNIELYRDTFAFFRTLKLNHIPLHMVDTIGADGQRNFVPGWVGGALNALDKLGIYGMVARHQPKKYYEIGSGISTYFAHAAVKYFNLDTRLVSIDPEPRAEIDSICAMVHKSGLENIDLDLFLELEAGDILFFDGSHRVFTNSDVTVFFLELLPRIKPGVIIHLHDITLPWDYPASFLNWYWSEQYMLALYLVTAKNSITPLLPMWYICYTEGLSRILDEPFLDLGEHNLQWKNGGSFWFSKK